MRTRSVGVFICVLLFSLFLGAGILFGRVETVSAQAALTRETAAAD